MIMPCMNSTSACERGSSLALVDAGRVLLGLPGAPGCTTTGVAGSVCCDHIAKQKNPEEQKKAAAVPTLIASLFQGASLTWQAARDSALNIICASFVDAVRSALLVWYVPIPK